MKMKIPGATAFDYSSLIHKKTNLFISKAAASDFQNIFNREEKRANNPSGFSSAKQSLQDKYPDLKYHVLDASQFTYWNRLDFPDSKLFVGTLKAWKPGTPTATGYEPWVQRDLEKIQKGLHVVFVHPVTQAKMDKDPEYAKQIADKIEKYFENDIRTNEAIDPESIKQMSQAVTITEDGEIGLHVTVCDGPSKKASDSDKAADTKRVTEQQALSPSQEIQNPLPLGGLTSNSFQYDYKYGIGFIPKRRSEDNDDK
jgi:hypothetical protein